MRKYIISLIVVLFAANQVIAQKVESYQLVLPSTIISGVHKIAVASYETNEKTIGVAAKFDRLIVHNLNTTKTGMHAKAELYNPWLSTQLNVMQSIEAGSKNLDDILVAAKEINADAVMVTATNVVEDYTAIPSDLKSVSLEGIPYKQKKFELKRVLKVTGTCKVIKTEDKSVLKSWDIDFSKESSATAYDYEGLSTLKSTATLADESGTYLTSLFVGMMKAKFVNYKYSFANIRKIKDKELKELDKEIVKLLRKNPKANLKIVYAKMLQLAEKGLPEADDNAKINYNLGLMNELVGNYKEAKEYYTKSRELDPGEKDYIKAMEQIEKLIAMKEVIKGQGFEIQDFVF